jgi:hypothetical protein
MRDQSNGKMVLDYGAAFQKYAPILFDNGLV